MHPIQVALLALSREKNLAQLTLRKMAEEIGLPDESPQKIKHHLLQLQKKGFLDIDKAKGVMLRAVLKPGLSKGLLRDSSLFSIPIIGIASAGPASIYAEQNFQGILRASSKLLAREKPDGLFAIKVSGSSMNLASINGRKIEDGDYAIIDSAQKNAVSGEIVLAIVDEKATIKRFIEDKENNQIVLEADSSFDYDPIYIHESDSFKINGKVVGVVKRPKSSLRK